MSGTRSLWIESQFVDCEHVRLFEHCTTFIYLPITLTYHRTQKPDLPPLDFIDHPTPITSNACLTHSKARQHSTQLPSPEQNCGPAYPSTATLIGPARGEGVEGSVKSVSGSGNDCRRWGGGYEFGHRLDTGLFYQAMRWR